MDLKTTWNKEKYEEYILYLKSLSEATYRDFSSGLTPTKYEMIGIRVPKCRKIAKEISQGDYLSFLKISKSFYYEEVLIKGFVLANIKSKEMLLPFLDEYISLIDNWAICDSFCNSLKIVKDDKSFWFDYFKDYLKTKEEFKIRVGLIIFLNFYIEESYLANIFKLIDSISVDDYYVNMGIAWLLCECYIKYPEKTLKYFLKSKINTFTFNKTISKIRESYRVSIDDKTYLNSLRK